MSKVHYRYMFRDPATGKRLTHPRTGEVPGTALCGSKGAHTPYAELVTCRACRRLLEQQWKVRDSAAG